MSQTETIIQLEDALEAEAYGITIHPPDNAFRLRFYDDDGAVLSTYTTDAAGAYELASRILRGYDKLEGL